MASRLVLLLLALGIPASANAQVAAGGAVGMQFDLPENFLIAGLKGLVPIGGTAFALQPGFDYFFEEGVTYVQADINGLFLAPASAGGLRLHVGAGAAWQYIRLHDVEAFEYEPEQEFGLNLVSGVTLDRSPVMPFVQTRYTALRRIPNVFTLSGGLLFRL